jgi:hypothetical protein
MGRMARDGELTRDSLVWTPGQDGWLPADDVRELAQLFTILPPAAAASTARGLGPNRARAGEARLQQPGRT